jgi:hypothetical protein
LQFNQQGLDKLPFAGNSVLNAKDKCTQKERESIMKNRDRKTSISKAGTLEEIGGFWDEHSLAAYWDQTEAVEFKINAERRRRIAIDPDSYKQISISSR